MFTKKLLAGALAGTIALGVTPAAHAQTDTALAHALLYADRDENGLSAKVDNSLTSSHRVSAKDRATYWDTVEDFGWIVGTLLTVGLTYGIYEAMIQQGYIVRY